MKKILSLFLLSILAISIGLADSKPKDKSDQDKPKPRIIVKHLETTTVPIITYGTEELSITLSNSLKHCTINISNTSLDVDYEFDINLRAGSVTIPTKLPEGSYIITITGDELEYLTEIKI